MLRRSRRRNSGSATRFAEPARLEILETLRSGEQTVSEIVERTGLGQGNVSKHLQLLFTHGFVARRKEGLNVFYVLADPAIFHLCDIMCDRVRENARAAAIARLAAATAHSPRR